MLMGGMNAFTNTQICKLTAPRFILIVRYIYAKFIDLCVCVCVCVFVYV